MRVHAAPLGWTLLSLPVWYFSYTLRGLRASTQPCWGLTWWKHSTDCFPHPPRTSYLFQMPKSHIWIHIPELSMSIWAIGYFCTVHSLVSVGILTTLEYWLDTSFTWRSAEQVEKKGFLLSFPAWTDIPNVDKHTKNTLQLKFRWVLKGIQLLS